jgi:hypothetical protein
MHLGFLFLYFFWILRVVWSWIVIGLDAIRMCMQEILYLWGFILRV